MRPLTLDDAQALQRIPNVVGVSPRVSGNAEAEANGRLRRVLVYGATSALVEAFNLRVSSGQFLPADDAESARNFVVLGAKLKQELFGADNALGARVRVGSLSFRVIGVMEARGQFLGIDLDDVAYIPAARALELFNRDSLMEINLTLRRRRERAARRRCRARRSSSRAMAARTSRSSRRRTCCARCRTSSTS